MSDDLVPIFGDDDEPDETGDELQVPIFGEDDDEADEDEQPSPTTSGPAVITMPYHQRLDPYWRDDLWDGGTRASWANRESVEMRQSNTARYEPGRSTGRPLAVKEVAYEKCVRGSGARTRLQALAAVGMWGTITSEQVATITGLQLPTAIRALNTCFDAGLLERGIPVHVPPGKPPRLWRLRSGPLVDQLDARVATYDELVSLTAGHKFGRAPSGDRHNILGVELGLRIAELVPKDQIAISFGEHIATHQMLVTGGSPKAAADLVAVRTDGLRLAFEITNSVSGMRRLISKISRWIDTLAGDVINSPTCVVFVDTSRPKKGDASIDGLRRAVDEALRSTALRPGVRDKVTERIAVARWTEWFPDEHQVSDGFRELVAHRPTGPGGQWEPASLVDEIEIPFDPVDPSMWTAVIKNTHTTWGIPHWMRNPKLGVRHSPV